MSSRNETILLGTGRHRITLHKVPAFDLKGKKKGHIHAYLSCDRGSDKKGYSLKKLSITYGRMDGSSNGHSGCFDFIFMTQKI